MMKNSDATGWRLCGVSSYLMLSFLLQTHGTISRTWITSSQGYPFKWPWSVIPLSKSALSYVTGVMPYWHTDLLTCMSHLESVEFRNVYFVPATQLYSAGINGKVNSLRSLKFDDWYICVHLRCLEHYLCFSLTSPSTFIIFIKRMALPVWCCPSSLNLCKYYTMLMHGMHRDI